MAQRSKKQTRRRAKRDARYLSRVPTRMPPGRVLAHNHIVHGTDWPSGINGFRFWTWPSRSKPRHFVLCPCGWSGLRHFARSGFVEDYRANPARYRRLVRRQEREWIASGELTEHGWSDT